MINNTSLVYLTKSLVMRICKGKKIFSAYINYLGLRVICNTQKINHKENPGHKILIIVPHADDELISCHSLIKKNKNVKLFFCSYTGTNCTIENKIQREKEFISYCRLMNVEYAISSSADIYSSMSTEISTYHPTALFIPSYIDWHNEHQIISDLVFDYLNNNDDRSIKKIVIYSVSVPIHYSFVNLAIGMSKIEQKEKWDLFKAIYVSQKQLPVYRFRLWERLYARCFKMGYATEFYHSFDKYDWTLWYKTKKGTVVPQEIVYHMIDTLSLSSIAYLSDE